MQEDAQCMGKQLGTEKYSKVNKGAKERKPLPDSLCHQSDDKTGFCSPFQENQIALLGVMLSREIQLEYLLWF